MDEMDDSRFAAEAAVPPNEGPRRSRCFFAE
jgi:hypothetical protein